MVRLERNLDTVPPPPRRLAESLGRPQSFVAKVESGERRIDVAEFISIAEAMGANPVRLFATVAKRLG